MNNLCHYLVFLLGVHGGTLVYWPLTLFNLLILNHWVLRQHLHACSRLRVGFSFCMVIRQDIFFKLSDANLHLCLGRNSYFSLMLEREIRAWVRLLTDKVLFGVSLTQSRLFVSGLATIVIPLLSKQVDRGLLKSMEFCQIRVSRRNKFSALWSI